MTTLTTADKILILFKAAWQMRVFWMTCMFVLAAFALYERYDNV